MQDIHQVVIKAENAIRKFITETPLMYSIALSHETGANVYLKCENLQYTGAFKVRGAINKLLHLTPSERAQGVVTASSGNHGAALAYGLQLLDIKGIIFVPENVSPTKADNIRNYTSALTLYGSDCLQTELHAKQYAKQHNMIYISPYNDLQIIGGQGTIGVELRNQLDHIDAVLVPVGGGGLISGIAGYLKSTSPDTKIYGCMPENSPVMAASIKAGELIEMETLPTLSDATAGGIEPGSITFDICQKYVDDYILVSENEIKQSLIHLIETQRLLVEGASGVALASLFKESQSLAGKNVVVVLSGGNISLPSLKNILS